MTEATAFVESAWRDGVGPDDRAALAAVLALPGASTNAELMLFSTWFDLLGELAVPVPPAPPTPAGAVVHAAAVLARARIARDAGAMQDAIDALADALDALPDDAPHAIAARAWADLSLGDVALAMNDPATMRQRFEAICVPERPVGLRITAMLRLVGVALSRFDSTPARRFARRALTLAESSKRPAQAARARLLLAMLEHVAGKHDSVRALLSPLLEDSESGLIARLLLAGVEDEATALSLFADGLRRATETGDVAAYLMCVLVGSRRYVTMGRRADALVTISAGIVELRKVAQPLAAVLEEERLSWRDDWGSEAWDRAEAEALALL